MAKIRIYEAAKKLNLNTKDLMARLNDMGITVKSPISFITQSDYDEVLDSMTSNSMESDSDKMVSLGVESKDEDTIEPAQLISESDAVDMSEFKLTLVSESGADSEDKLTKIIEDVDKVVDQPEPQPAAAIDMVEENIAEASGKEIVEPEVEVKPKVEEEKAPAAAMVSQPAGRSPIPLILSFAAIGMAAAALLVAFMFQGNITQNTGAVKGATQSVTVLKSQVATANTGIINNQNLINSNRAAIESVDSRITEMNKTQVKSNLSSQAAVLEEVSTALPQNVADKVRAISKGLNSLSFSI